MPEEKPEPKDFVPVEPAPAETPGTSPPLEAEARGVIPPMLPAVELTWSEVLNEYYAAAADIVRALRENLAPGSPGYFNNFYDVKFVAREFRSPNMTVPETAGVILVIGRQSVEGMRRLLTGEARGFEPEKDAVN